MTAGGSARRQYERRLVLHRAKVRRALPRLAVLVLVVVPVVWVLVDRLAPGVGGVASLVVAIGLTKHLWPSKGHVDAWASGAAGEAKVGRALERLGPEYEVLHDRRIPGSRANIDHVVVGPTGVFVIETKNVAGKVRVNGGHLVVAGRRKQFVEQAQREAAAVQTVAGPMLASLELDVRSLLCFTKADLPWRKTIVGDVPLLTPKGVVRVIRMGAARLEPGEVRRLADLIRGSLKPA